MNTRKPTKRARLGRDSEQKLVLDGEDLQYKKQDRLWRFVEEFEVFRDLHAFGESDASEIKYRAELFLEAAEHAAKGFQKYLNHETTTLDEAFDLKRPKGYRRAIAHEERVKERALQRTGRMFRSAGAAIDDAFFAVLGEIYGVSKTKASVFYYRERSHVPVPAPPPPGTRPLAKEYAQFIDQLTWLEGYFPRIFQDYGNTK